jgi:hypothetical protein
MTDPQAIAEKITNGLEGRTFSNQVDFWVIFKSRISAALREYGEECVEEAWGKDEIDHFRRVRNVAIEEAAKVAENRMHFKVFSNVMPDTQYPAGFREGFTRAVIEIAQSIRALAGNVYTKPSTINDGGEKGESK